MVSFPINRMVTFHNYVSLPEGSQITRFPNTKPAVRIFGWSTTVTTGPLRGGPTEVIAWSRVCFTQKKIGTSWDWVHCKYTVRDLATGCYWTLLDLLNLLKSIGASAQRLRSSANLPGAPRLVVVLGSPTRQPPGCPKQGGTTREDPMLGR